jgi:hypothetical protein
MALPLQPELLARNALSRFLVALAMALGAPMQVRAALIDLVTVVFSDAAVQ